MPISSVVAGTVDFLLAFCVLLVMMLHYRVSPTRNIVFLPLFFLLTLTTSLGMGLWLSALNVKFRDVRLVLPFLVQIWMFATPIAYPSSLLHEPWRTVYGLNPMVGVVEGFRWALLGVKSPAGPDGHCFRSDVGAAAAGRCDLLPANGKDVRRFGLTLKTIQLNLQFVSV